MAISKPASASLCDSALALKPRLAAIALQGVVLQDMVLQDTVLKNMVLQGMVLKAMLLQVKILLIDFMTCGQSVSARANCRGGQSC